MPEMSQVPETQKSRAVETPTLEETEIPSKVNEGDSPESQGEKTESGVGPVGRQKSLVWSHFIQIKVDGKPKAKCIHCKAELVAGSRNGTSHLREHKEKCPKIKNKDIRQCLLTGKQNSDSSNLSLNVYNFNQDASRKDLTVMIILHEYLLSMVDHFGFRKFCGGLQPLFKVVSRNTLKRDVMKVYSAEKEQLMSMLFKNRGRIAVTSDMWTANHQTKSYMAITIHFIDNAWNLHRRILRFVYVPISHTSEVLSKVLEESLFQWNIDRKLSIITLDNCSTNESVMDYVLCSLQRSSLILRGRLLHMRCDAHILNLVVQDGLSVIHAEIEKVRESVRFWTASPKKEQRFEDAAFQIGPDDGDFMSILEDIDDDDDDDEVGK